MAERAGREIIGRIAVRVLAVCVLGFALLYAFDYIILRFRAATGRSAFGTVTVHPVYAVAKKNRSVEYMTDDPHDETCVNSLLPHMGHSACWYLRRNPEQRINL